MTIKFYVNQANYISKENNLMKILINQKITDN